MPLAAGWASATWIALTMHGWWWPGRQVVVVLPCVVLATAWWAGSRSRVVVGAIAGLGALGVVFWGWLVREVREEHLRLIIDFEATRNPLYRAWRLVLPDLRLPNGSTPVLFVLWTVAAGGPGLVGLAVSRR